MLNLQKVLLISTLAELALVGSVLWATSSSATDSDATNDAFSERATDELATHSNNAAILRTKKALERNRGTSDEADLLYVLGDLQLRSADLRFRTTHNDSNPKDREVRIEKYETWMNQAISTFKEFSKKFPQDARVVQATYLTAKAEIEMDRRKDAENTLRHLVHAYPNTKEARIGAEDLTSLLVEKGAYTEALDILSRFHPKPGESGYPTYLRNRAWAYYQTGEIKIGFETLIQLINLLAKLPEEDPNRRQYYSSAGENLAIFYAAGMKQKISGFELKQSLSTFKRISPQAYPEVMAYFALQLRGSGDGEVMTEFLKMVEYKELENPAAIKVSFILFEGIANLQDQKYLADAAKSLVHLSKYQSKTQSAEVLAPLKSVTGRLQTRFAQNQKAPGVRETASVLRDLLCVLLKATDQKDTKVINELNYNLGTLALFLDDYPEAIRYFSQSNPTPDSALGSLEAHFLLAQKSGALPQKIEVKKVSPQDPSDGSFAEPGFDHVPVGAQPSLAKLIHALSLAMQEKVPLEKLEKYRFEVGRAIYHHGFVWEGVLHLRSFVMHYPQSERAGIAAALVMDTLVQSKSFALADQFSQEISANKTLRSSPIKEQILSAGAEARLKGAQDALQQGRYADALNAAKKYLSENPKATHLREAALIAGNASVKTEGAVDAEALYAKAIDENHTNAPEDATTLGGLLARAELRESRFDYKGASTDLLKALHLHELNRWLKAGDLESIRRNAIELAWASGGFKGLVTDSQLCPKDGTPTPGSSSERCEVLGLLSGDSIPVRSRHANQIRSLLSGGSLKDVAKTWESLTSEDQIALIGFVTKNIPAQFTRNIQAALQQSPIAADPKAIAKRIEIMKSLDQLSAAIIELPIASIQAEILKSLSNAYLRTYQEISALRPAETWKSFALPFFQKANDFDGQAIQLAANRGVDESTVRKLLGPRSSMGLESAPVHTLSEDVKTWLEGEIPSTAQNFILFKSAMISAIQKGNLPLIAKLSQEGIRIKALNPDHLDLIRAMLFDLAGARAEAVGALENSLNQKTPLHASVSTLLVEVFARLGSKSKIREIAKKSGDQLPPAIAEWSGVGMVPEAGRAPAASSPAIATPKSKEIHP